MTPSRTDQFDKERLIEYLLRIKFPRLVRSARLRVPSYMRGEVDAARKDFEQLTDEVLPQSVVSLVCALCNLTFNNRDYVKSVSSGTITRYTLVRLRAARLKQTFQWHPQAVAQINSHLTLWVGHQVRFQQARVRQLERELERAREELEFRQAKLVEHLSS